MNEILLSVKQVADFLEKSESTVRRMEESGAIKSIGEGQYRFPLFAIIDKGKALDICSTLLSAHGITFETIVRLNN